MKPRPPYENAVSFIRSSDERVDVCSNSPRGSKDRWDRRTTMDHESSHQLCGQASQRPWHPSMGSLSTDLTTPNQQQKTSKPSSSTPMTKTQAMKHPLKAISLTILSWLISQTNPTVKPSRNPRGPVQPASSSGDTTRPPARSAHCLHRHPGMAETRRLLRSRQHPSRDQTMVSRPWRRPGAR